MKKQFRGYKKKDLSKENLGPDAISYEGVKYRIKQGKHIRIFYSQGYKNPAIKELFLDYATSRKINRGLDLLQQIEDGQIEIKKIIKK